MESSSFCCLRNGFWCLKQTCRFRTIVNSAYNKPQIHKPAFRSQYEHVCAYLSWCSVFNQPPAHSVISCWEKATSSFWGLVLISWLQWWGLLANSCTAQLSDFKKTLYHALCSAVDRSNCWTYSRFAEQRHLCCAHSYVCLSGILEAASLSKTTLLSDRNPFNLL